MHRTTLDLVAVALLSLALPAGAAAGVAPQYDHLECFDIVRDLRTVPAAEVDLTPKDLEDFAEQSGCRIGPNASRPRAREYCVPVAKTPNDPPTGQELDASYICYNLRCDNRGVELRELEVQDQFGEGTVVLRKTRGNQRLCVPVNPCHRKPDGTVCDDMDPETTGDMCTAGVCGGQGLSPVVEAALQAIDSVRANVDPPCDPAAPNSPCGPDNGNRLPGPRWNQALADEAASVADQCPIFAPNEDLIYLHFSPDPITPVQLVEAAIANWAAKRIQYDPVTGNCLRPGDLSCLTYPNLLTPEEIGVAVKVDCPNSRFVVVMRFSPGPVSGPAYPPLFP